jgi:hypothetical protein
MPKEFLLHPHLVFAHLDQLLAKVIKQRILIVQEDAAALETLSQLPDHHKQ